MARLQQPHPNDFLLEATAWYQHTNNDHVRTNLKCRGSRFRSIKMADRSLRMGLVMQRRAAITIHIDSWTGLVAGRIEMNLNLLFNNKL